MIEKITKKAELENMRFFVDFISRFLEKTEFSKNSVFDILQASEEILINIINYAYPEGAGDVEVICKYEKENNKISITFTDNGIYFDMRTAKKPDLTLLIERRRVGGVGIYLVKTLMNEILYNRENEKNVLTIIKSEKL